MIWGVRLFPGQESRHLVSNQLHLTLASLDCRPGKTCVGSATAAYLLMKTPSCENVICSLEKGQTNQQQLDLVLQPGETVTFKVEGNGHVYLTGYSWIGPDSCRDHLSVPDTRSIYTGLLPSFQETPSLVPSFQERPSLESKQNPAMMKSSEQQSQSKCQPARQVPNTLGSSSSPYNRLMSSDKGWIPEEDQTPLDKPTRVVPNEVVPSDHTAMSEELVAIVEQPLEEDEHSMEDTCSSSVSNETTTVKRSEVVPERTRQREPSTDTPGVSFARVEHTHDSDGGLACERDPDDGVIDVCDSERQGQSYEHVSDMEAECKTDGEHTGQSGEKGSDGKVNDTHDWSNKDPSRDLNDAPKCFSEGDPAHMLEGESFPGSVRDEMKAETSHSHCAEPESILTVVVEDKNSGATTSGNMTETIPGSNSDQVVTLEVKEETDNSDKIINLYQCRICGKVLPSEDSFRIHNEMHARGDQNLPQSQCCNVRSDDITEQNQEYAEGSSETYHLSGNDYSNSSDRVNVEEVYNPKRVLHECQYCGKVVSSKASLKVHMRLHPEHTGETERKLDESLRCQLCGKYFSNISNRRRHEKMHTNGKSFKCYVCGKQLQNNWHLNEHLRTHTEESLQKCQTSKVVLVGDGNKFQHDKMHFGGTVPFECRYCGKTFESPSGGRRHEAMHTGNRAYKCRFCDKTFNDRRCRESHEGRVHTGEKRYKCQICVKSFYGRSDLVVHMRVHTGEKRYKCQYCDELFTYYTSAKRHEARHVEGSIQN